MKRILCLSLLIFAGAGASFGQEASPSPTPTPVSVSREQEIEAQKALIDKERELLEARRKYLKEIADAFSYDPQFGRDKAGGTTSFATEQTPILETVSLSYEAIGELSSEAERRLAPILSGYDRVVIYNKQDFESLSQYRLFREQSRLTLDAYDQWRRAVDAAAAKGPAGGDDVKIMTDGSRSAVAGFLTSMAGVPSIVKSAVGSVAELLSMFRTDTTITESSNIIQDGALKAVMAGTLLRSFPQMRVYNPDQFTPEYDIGVGQSDLLYGRMMRLDAAEADIDYFISEAGKLSARDKAVPEVSRLILAAGLVKRQIRKIAFAAAPQGEPPSSAGEAAVAWFRQMLAAEKLANFLERPGLNGASPRAGILKVRVLSSGGSRRERKNLILGARTDYSGSAVMEIALYDADGTMRFSDVLSHHTGFRKFKTGSARP